ncbi:MAG: diguanylate cyclase [Acidimicrobiales bacterium]
MGRPGSNDPRPERGGAATRPAAAGGEVVARLLDHLEHSPDLIAVVDPAGNVRYLNQVAQEAVARHGLDRPDLSLTDLLEPEAFLTYQDLVRPALLRDEVWQGPLRLRLDSDQERWVTMTGDGAGGGDGWLVAAARPSSLDRPHPGDHLARGRDELTGLTTRGGLAERLEVALARARRSGRPVAVAFVDLDDLKAINDRFGHLAGDVVLTEVAHRLSDAVRAIDLVARTGGDEFVVVFDGVEDDDEAEALLVRLQAAVESGAIGIDEGLVHVSVSVGIATSAGHDAPEVLLRRADAAMYDAKGERRRPPGRDDHHWEGEAPTVRDVAVALTQGRIAPGYWAVTTSDRSHLAGVQAAARWHGPDGIWRPAADFAPLVARTGVGFSLELAILNQVVADAPSWIPQPGRLYVHASRSFLERRGVARFFAEVVGRGGVPASSLGLVVASEDLVGRVELVQRPLWELHELGVHLVVGLGPGSPPIVPDLVEAVFDEVRLEPAFARAGLGGAGLAAIADAAGRGHRHGLQVRLAGVGDARLAERAASAGVELLEGPIAAHRVERGPERHHPRAPSTIAS